MPWSGCMERWSLLNCWTQRAHGSVRVAEVNTPSVWMAQGANHWLLPTSSCRVPFIKMLWHTGSLVHCNHFWEALQLWWFEVTISSCFKVYFYCYKKVLLLKLIGPLCVVSLHVVDGKIQPFELELTYVLEGTNARAYFIVIWGELTISDIQCSKKKGQRVSEWHAFCRLAPDPPDLLSRLGRWEKKKKGYCCQ